MELLKNKEVRLTLLAQLLLSTAATVSVFFLHVGAGCIVLALCLILCGLPARARAVNMEIAGKSALLMDIATGTVLYEQNAHEMLAPARARTGTQSTIAKTNTKQPNLRIPIPPS